MKLHGKSCPQPDYSSKGRGGNFKPKKIMEKEETPKRSNKNGLGLFARVRKSLAEKEMLPLFISPFDGTDLW